MKAGSDTFISADLLDQGEGINGFTNILTITNEYGASIKRVYNSNINITEKPDEFILEDLSQLKNPTVIIEEDIFGKEKVWIKSGSTADHIIKTLSDQSVLNKKLKKEIYHKALTDLYESKAIQKNISAKFDEISISLIGDYLNTDKMFKKFSSLLEEKGINFIVDNNECFIHIKDVDLNIIKKSIEKDVKRIIDTKQLLLEKTALNEKSEPSKKIKKPTTKKI